jgi:hypothetical protein
MYVTHHTVILASHKQTMATLQFLDSTILSLHNGKLHAYEMHEPQEPGVSSCSPSVCLDIA